MNQNTTHDASEDARPDVACSAVLGRADACAELMNGFRKLDGYGDEVPGLSAYTNGVTIILCGRPAYSADELNHDCDRMGCGWEHVIARFALNGAA